MEQGIATGEYYNKEERKGDYSSFKQG